MSARRIPFLLVLLAASAAATVGAAPAVRAADPIPPGCHPYSAEGDYACAGMALRFHTAGSAVATSDIWAGQWLFTDDAGHRRIGSCVFNRGLHPPADAPAQPVALNLPNDPGGARSAYLTWRYGDTRDDLTAAALWALFHFYAQDPAGSERAHDPEQPLVPSLDVLASASGVPALQELAVALDREAARYAAAFTLDLAAGGSTVTATVRSGSEPVPDVAVTWRGGEARTDANGQVMTDVEPGDAAAAIVWAPAVPAAYLAQPLHPHAYGGQVLLAAAPPVRLDASIEVPRPTTTTVAPTTTTTTEPPPPPTPPPTEAPTTETPPTTEAETTTTTEGPTSTSETPPTEAPTTEASTTTTVEAAVVAPPVPSTPPPVDTLPATGSARGVATAAAVVLGLGIGALVGLRRRLQTPAADPW